jgi:hypothetical protein
MPTTCRDRGFAWVSRRASCENRGTGLRGECRRSHTDQRGDAVRHRSIPRHAALNPILATLVEQRCIGGGRRGRAVDPFANTFHISARSAWTSRAPCESCARRKRNQGLIPCGRQRHAETGGSRDIHAGQCAHRRRRNGQCTEQAGPHGAADWTGCGAFKVLGHSTA